MCACAWKWSACLLHVRNDAIVSQWSAVYVFPRMQSGRSVRVRKSRPCSQYNHKLFSGDMLSFIQVQPCAPHQPLAECPVGSSFLQRYSSLQLLWYEISCHWPSSCVVVVVSQCSCVCCLSTSCLAEANFILRAMSLSCCCLLSLEISALPVWYACIKEKGGNSLFNELKVWVFCICISAVSTLISYFPISPVWSSAETVPAQLLCFMPACLYCCVIVV